MKTKRLIALSLMIVMLMAALPLGTPALASLTPSAWALPEMTAANTSGLLTPSAARDFHNALTRDEFCELVVEMVELTLGHALPVPASNPFTSDVEPISIHALKAWSYGIITGITNTLFAPSQKVERQQLCAMMIRAMRGLERDLNRTLLSPGITTLPYRDAAQIRDYAIEPVQLAYANVIMQGNEQGLFMPANDITSQECVAVIIRTFNRIEAARTPGMTADQLLDAAAARVHIGYAYGDTEDGVTQNLTLPVTSTGGASVAWTSNNGNVIRAAGATGVVTVGTYPQSVTLTATIRIGNGFRTKTFDLTTSPNTGDRLLLDNAQNKLDILYLNDGDGDGTITGRIGLPTTVLGLPVTWQSSNPSAVSAAGIVNIPNGSETYNAVLTATIRYGSQTRVKTFNLSVVNPSFSRGVTLHGVQLGMTQAQTTQTLGAPKKSINAGNNETWQLYYGTNYSTFIAVAFISDRAVAVYSMAPGAANMLRNRSGSVISVAEANSTGGISAVSYLDPGDSSQQYAIMIYDSTSVIGTTRTLLAEGQEQFLFELVNAFRQRNGKTSLEWSAKLGSPARAHSNDAGSGNLQQRVTSSGFDSARYSGGNIIPGNGDAIDALSQIVSNASGSAAMRTAVLQNNINLFGAGFSGGNSGAYRTYFTYALGAVNAISGASARQNDTNVTTVNVSAGAANAMTVSLVISPSGYNESVTVDSSNKSIMTVTNYSAANGTVLVTGVANGNANITVTGNCSGKSYNIPVSVGTVYATNLALSYTPTGMSATTLSSSTNIAANANDNKTGSQILVIGVSSSITIAATTTAGATVEWTRTNNTNAGTVARSTTNNNGVVTATATAGDIVVRARVQTGANSYITHTITVRVISPPAITVDKSTVNVGDVVTASINLSGLPGAPVCAWTADSQLTRTSAVADNPAKFKAEREGAPKISLTLTWNSTGSNAFLGRITKTADITVRGNLFADNIALSRRDVTLIPGQDFSITASTVPEVVTQPYSFAWRSSDTSIATVGGSGTHNANGKITAVAPGTTDIIVDLTQGNPVNAAYTYTAVIRVTVVDFPTITIDLPGSIVANSETVFSYTLHYPSGVTQQALPRPPYDIRWVYTDDDNEHPVASIDVSRGTMVPVGAGSGTVRVELWYIGRALPVDFDELHITILSS